MNEEEEDGRGKTKNRRRHVASIIFGEDKEEEEEEEEKAREGFRETTYLNSEAKDANELRAHVAQIRDFLLGNVFSPTGEDDDDDDDDDGEKKEKKTKNKRANVALAVCCNQSFFAHFLALSEIPFVNFTVLLNSRWSSLEAKKAMEHCECTILIADEFHRELWSDFEDTMRFDVNECMILKARPFYSCDRRFRKRHDIVLKKSWFQREDEKMSKKKDNADAIGGGLFGKGLELVVGNGAVKEKKEGVTQKEDEDCDVRDTFTLEDINDTFTLEDINVVEHYEEEKEKETKEDAKMIRVEHQDVRNNCCLVFTSGTSGYAPKAAILSHSNLAAAIDSKLYDQNGPQYNSEDIYLHCAPLYHVGGLISGLAAIKADAKHIFLESFDARSFLHAIVTAEVTAFIAVPTMLRKIQRICKDTHMTPRPTTVSSAVQSKSSRFESVKKILVGGGPMHEKDVAFARKIFPNAKIISTYGMTEASSSIAYANLTHIETSMGRRMASASDMSLGDNWVVTANSQVNQGKIIDGLSVKIDRAGDENEIVIRGETVSKGYYNTPATPLSHGDDRYNDMGYFRTGDIGELSKDSTTIRILGRLSNRIKTGGENVSCVEVEKIVEKHKLVQESVVYGVPDDVWGEIVACAVRLEPDVEWERMTENVNNPDAWAFMKYAEERKDSSRIVNEDLLRLWCLKNQLARFKVPKQWVFFKDDFPRNSGDKVDLSKLRAITLGRPSLDK